MTKVKKENRNRFDNFRIMVTRIVIRVGLIIFVKFLFLKPWKILFVS